MLHNDEKDWKQPVWCEIQNLWELSDIILEIFNEPQNYFSLNLISHDYVLY